MANPPHLTELLDRVVLSATVEAALALAASERPPGTALRTGPVLEALSRADTLGYWNRFWLRAEAHPAGLVTASDDGFGPDQSDNRWRGVPVSPSLAHALRVLERLAGAYRMAPVPPGALALVLVAERGSGALRVLSAQGATQAELLELVQSDLLGVTLENVESVLDGPEEWWGAPLDDVRDDIEVLLTGMQFLPVRDAVAQTGLDPDVARQYADQARTLGTNPAPTNRGRPLDVEDVVDTLTYPSPGLCRLIGLSGATGPELAATVRLRTAAPDTPPTSAVHLCSVLNYMLLFGMIAVLADRAYHGSWWLLLLTPLVFAGPPSGPSLFAALAALALWPLGGVGLAVLKLAETVVGFWLSRGERRGIAARTGVLLTEAEHNRLLHRRQHTAALLAVRTRMMLTVRLSRLEQDAADRLGRTTG